MVELKESSVVLAQARGTAAESKKSPGRDQKTNQSEASAVQKALSRIFALLVVYGLDRTAEYGSTITHWIGLVRELEGPDAWVKLTKYKLAAFFAYWTNQPLPKRPFKSQNDNPGLLFGGRVGRWLRSFLLRRRGKDGRFSEEAFGLLASVKQSKKALPRPSKSFVRKAESEAFEKLTKPRWQPNVVRVREDVRWADVDAGTQSIPMPIFGRSGRAKATHLYTGLAEIKAELRRTVQEVFADTRYSVADRLSPFLPSTSANYVNSRVGGGAVGWSLRCNASILSGLREPNYIGLDWQSGDASDEKRFAGMAEGVAELERLDAQAAGLGELEVSDQGLRMKFSNLYYRLLRAAQDEVPHAVPFGLAEALKARVITKCAPALMTVMKPLQRAMWRTLQKHPCFRLVGQPIDAWYLQDRLRLDEQIRDDEGFLSGDYSDATNELASWVSEEIALEIGRIWKLSTTETNLLLRSLTGFQLVHPEDESRVEGQRNGQLMGSVTSFPILCLANAALCRHAMELGEGRSYSLSTLPGCFNGDDVVLRMRKSTRYVWKVVTGFAGLSESVGKTYFSNEFLEMNSRLFLRRVEPLPLMFGPAGQEVLRNSWLSAVPFVNAGLMFGQKRSGRLSENDVAGPEDAYRPSAGQCAMDLVDTAPDFVRDRAMKEFIKINRPWLEKLKVPWYIPRWLGGVGLPAWDEDDGSHHGPTQLDLAKAKYILLNWAKRRPTLGSDAEWKLHELACKKLPAPLSVDESELTEEQRRDSDRLYGDAVVACLFDSNLSARDMWIEGLTNARSLKSLSKNTSLWSKAKPLAADERTIEVVFGRRGTRKVEYWPVRFRNEERQVVERFSAFDLETFSDLEQFESSGLLARVCHQGPADSL